MKREKGERERAKRGGQVRHWQGTPVDNSRTAEGLPSGRAMRAGVKKTASHLAKKSDPGVSRMEFEADEEGFIPIRTRGKLASDIKLYNET